MKPILFRLMNGGDWAFITIAKTDKSQAFLIMIHSVYGSWSYIWSQPGDDFISFIQRIDVNYTFIKFSNVLRMGGSNRLQKIERERYHCFYNIFWPLLIKELKENSI